jgi:SAM-dependent methyltransferase
MGLYQFIRKNTPKELRKKLDAFTYNWSQEKWTGKKLICPCCNSRLKGFLRLQDVCDGIFYTPVTLDGVEYPVTSYETFNCDQFLCPVCSSTDRGRLYTLFIKKKIPKNLTSKFKIIHFAPDNGLREFLQKQPNIEYVSSDFNFGGVDLHLDLRDMNSISSDSLDSFICSHILEHIVEDDLAISELFRVLKPGSWGILMAPIMLGLSKTHEDPQIKSQEDRIKAYGMEDHVRMYSKLDYIEKISKPGFIVRQIGNDYFDFPLGDYGISEKSILYVVEKTASL